MESTSNEDWLCFLKMRIGGARRRCGPRFILGKYGCSAPDLEVPFCRDGSSHLSSPAEEEAQRDDMPWWRPQGAMTVGFWAGKRFDTVLPCHLCVSLGELTQDQLELYSEFTGSPRQDFPPRLPNSSPRKFAFVRQEAFGLLWCWDQMQGLGHASKGNCFLLFYWMLAPG